MIPDQLAKLRALSPDELPAFANALRAKIIESVCRNGGHLASSCGCVELIVALHRVFRTPEEKIFFDVGHQSYAHKLITGREEGFEKLRRHDRVGHQPCAAAVPQQCPDRADDGLIFRSKLYKIRSQSVYVRFIKCIYNSIIGLSNR